MINNLELFARIVRYSNNNNYSEKNDFKEGDRVSLHVKGINLLKGQLSFTLLGKEN